MNPESDFRIESTYDRQAYQAMAKATWKLFQKHRMEVMAYPALISVALVIAVLLVFNWNHTVLPIRILGIAFIVLQFAVIPWARGALKPRRAGKRSVMRKNGANIPPVWSFVPGRPYPYHSGEGSHVGSLPGGQPFGRSEGLAVPLFRAGAYIIPVSAFRDAAELDRFDTFITGKCGMPIVILEGKYPRADGTQEGEETDAGVRAYFHC